MCPSPSNTTICKHTRLRHQTPLTNTTNRNRDHTPSVLVKHTCICAYVRHDRPRLLCCPCIRCVYKHLATTGTVTRDALLLKCAQRRTHTHTNHLDSGLASATHGRPKGLTTDSVLRKETCVCAPSLTTGSPLLPNDAHYNHNNTPFNPFRNTRVCVTTRNHDHEFLSAHGRLHACEIRTESRQPEA